MLILILCFIFGERKQDSSACLHACLTLSMQPQFSALAARQITYFSTVTSKLCEL